MTTRYLTLALWLGVACSSPPAGYDLLLVGGEVIDGTGAPRFRADVGLRGDRIVTVSRTPLAESLATRVLDATGRVVAPGFVDLHAHLDPLLELPEAVSHLRQGVTTALGGPDGGGPLPLGFWLDTLEAVGIGLNVGYLVGHNRVRREVMGLDNRGPSDGELARMEALVAEAMDDGAWGLSTGLKYLPGTFATTDEIVALATVAARAGGIYTSHLRDEGLGLIESVAEAIEIGRRAGIPVVLTHHKVVGQPMWGASRRTLAMVDSARAAGVDVMMDQYPYTATYTGITVLIPAWGYAGGRQAFLDRLEVPALHDSIVRGIVFNIVNDRGGGDLGRVQLALVPWDRSLEGKTLNDWARRKHLPSTPETGAELVIEAVRRGGASAIYHVLDEDDVERIMRHPQTMIASDGRLTEPGRGHPHPRWYGTFPRVLGHYVRDRHLFSLEEAVRRMSSMPATRMGLTDRGRIAQGLVADLVVFDPDRVIDRSTFDDPHRYPAGIDYVIVNGTVAVDQGRPTGQRAGRILRHRVR